MRTGGQGKTGDLAFLACFACLPFPSPCALCSLCCSLALKNGEAVNSLVCSLIHFEHYSQVMLV